MVDFEGRTPLEKARRAWSDRNLWAAKALIEEALASDLQGEDLARARLTGGAIFREFGDSAAALDQFTALMDEWHRYPQVRPIWEGYAFYNQSLVHYQRREYAESVSYNRLAAAEFRRERMTDHLRRALQNLAWSLCCLGIADEADEALAEAEPLCEGEEALWQQRIGRAFTAYAAGGFHETIKAAADIVMAGEAQSDVMSHALWLMGLSKLALGALDDSLQIADGAVRYALQTQDTRCLSDAQRLRRAVMEAKQTRGA